MTYLAFQDRTDLTHHSRAVAAVARYLAQGLGTSEKVKRLCEVAGLVHDIGKVDTAYQKYLEYAAAQPPMPESKKLNRAAQEGEEMPITANGRCYPNELAYLALCNRKNQLLLSAGLDDDESEIVQQAVLWHHACQHSAQPVTATDLQPVMDYAAELLGVPTVPARATHDELDAPLLFSAGKVRLLVRMCVISANYIVSDLSPELVQEIATGVTSPRGLSRVRHLLGGIDLAGALPVPADWRGEIQHQCATDDRGRITQVNAPTGFGKTRIGILQTLHRRRRTLWVCPRNAVAEAVYYNAVAEIKAMGLDLSVELYLTSERKASNDACGSDPFTADIIVTNLDMLLKPMLNNGMHERAYWSLHADVILDEYHEYVTRDSALLASIRNLLGARVLCGVSRTMCLSATPSLLLSSLAEHVNVLPEPGKHYPNIHSKAIRLHLHPNATLQDLPTDGDGTMIMCNAVRNVQNNHRRGNARRMCMHSKYTDVTRRLKLMHLMEQFGPKSVGSETVNAGPILQAAVNVSFSGVHIVSGGPEMDIQAARTNRFGEFEKGQLDIYSIDDLSERAAVDIRGSSKIQRLWFQFLVDRYGTEPVDIVADHFYRAYNDFYAEHHAVLVNQVDMWQAGGAEAVRYLAPTYTVGANTGKVTGKISRANLRNPTGSLYVLVRRAGTREWMDIADAFPISRPELVQILNTEAWCSSARDQDVLLKRVPSPRMRTAWKTTPEAKRIRVAANPETPFPTEQLVYDEELGLVRVPRAGVELAA